MSKIILFALVTAFRSWQQLALENLALRHQLAVLQRTARQPERPGAHFNRQPAAPNRTIRCRIELLGGTGGNPGAV
jgi:hypothetical protein